MDKNFRVTAKAEIGAHYCTHPGKSFDDGNNYGCSVFHRSDAMKVLSLV